MLEKMYVIEVSYGNYVDGFYKVGSSPLHASSILDCSKFKSLEEAEETINKINKSGAPLKFVVKEFKTL